MIFDIKCDDCGEIEERIINGSNLNGYTCNKCQSKNISRHWTSAPSYNHKSMSFKHQQKQAGKNVDLNTWRTMLDKITPGTNNRKLI